MTFEDLKIIEPILKALKEEKYKNPTAIQEQSIPIILEGKDLLGCAQTGTGKTAAFAIPIIQKLYADKQGDTEEKRKLRCLVVTPTRELALQIGDSFEAYARHLDLKFLVIFGGVSQIPQTFFLTKGIEILVATPGRLLDLIDQGYAVIDDVKYFVLDEADRMLDMGFVNDIIKLIQLLPKERQSLFFSATMPPSIIKLSETILNQPESVTVTPVSSTVDIIKQYVYPVSHENKGKLLIHILKEKNIKSALVFTRTKQGADKIVQLLSRNNIRAEAIHGNKEQNMRQRALDNFKRGKTRVLVATDIASRGIDVDSLEYVINFEISSVPETYVHRIGRTGRAGADGTAISFCDRSEKKNLKGIENLINKQLFVVRDHPYLPKPPQNTGRNQNGKNTEPKEPQG